MPHLYIDAKISVSDARGAVYTSFGPFSNRERAESALIKFIGRENAHSATIRDPDA